MADRWYERHTAESKCQPPVGFQLYVSGTPLIGMADRLYERHTAESKCQPPVRFQHYVSGTPLLGMADRLYERHTANSNCFDIIVFSSGEPLGDQTDTLSRSDLTCPGMAPQMINPERVTLYKSFL